MGWRMIHENPSPLNPRAASLSYPHDGQAPMKKICAPEAMLPDGWIRDVVVEIDDEGNIAAARGRQNAAGAESAGGAVIPGMANVHSHALQRAMAGLAERMGSPEDSFWTWREVMYSFLKQLGPDHVSAIASQLYCEMLKNGYTAVAEFHYLHNAPDGKPYANRVEMAQQHLLAAQRTGIAMTLLPSLYAYGNFGEVPLAPAQKRFATTPLAVLGMVSALKKQIGDNPDMRFGVAPHSLRAVSPAMLKDLIDGLSAVDRKAPIHIHLAEQVKEVNDCLTWSGQRPVEWLFSNLPVDSRWCLAHCTHISQSEAEKLSASGAVVGLCPTTEGNLGDGIFPFYRFREKRGRWGIGGGRPPPPTPRGGARRGGERERPVAPPRHNTPSPPPPPVGAT